MRPLACLIVLFSAARAVAAPVALHIPPGVGLEEAERAALASRVSELLASRHITAVPVATLDDGCAATPTCVAAAVDGAGAQGMLVIEVIKAGDEAEVSETVLDKAGQTISTSNQTVSGSVATLTPTEATSQALAAFATAAVEPPPTTTPAQGDGRLGLGLALRADLALLHGRTFGVTVAEPRLDNTLAGDGIKGFGGGWLFQLSWHLPIDGHWLNRAFGVEFDVGYSVSGTNGSIPFTQYETQDGATSLVTTTYDYASVLHMVPISLGLRSRLPLQDLGLPVHIDVSAGGNALWGASISTATVQGESVAFATENAASDFAFGFYAEGGVAYRLGPGELTGAYRYVSSYLDFEHAAFNPDPGDLGGHHLLLGYRFTL